jgi:hypothetical protein
MPTELVSFILIASIDHEMAIKDWAKKVKSIFKGEHKDPAPRLMMGGTKSQCTGGKITKFPMPAQTQSLHASSRDNGYIFPDCNSIN